MVIAIKYRNPEEGLNHASLLDEVLSFCELSGTPYLFLDDASAAGWQEASVPIHPAYDIGDISFYSNTQGLSDDCEGWTSNRLHHPRCLGIVVPAFKLQGCIYKLRVTSSVEATSPVQGFKA